MYPYVPAIEQLGLPRQFMPKPITTDELAMRKWTKDFVNMIVEL
jgi:hypothetical protein